MTLPDWLQDTAQRIETLEGQGRMPHALLLSGVPGTGLEHLADAIAMRALREPTSDFPQMRLLLLAHADLKLVQPTSDKASHSVETIREIEAWLHLTPQLGERKVVVVTEAHRMSLAANHGFLKTLEEPPLGSLIILVTYAPSRLLPTVRSRLQRFDVRPPGIGQSLAWIASRHQDITVDQMRAHLFEAGGAPLAADQALCGKTSLLGPLFVSALHSRQATGLVEKLASMDADAWLSVWMRYCVLAMMPVTAHAIEDAALESPSVAPVAVSQAVPISEDARAIAECGLDAEHLWQFWCRLTETRRMVHEGIALNTRLTVENLVAEWARLGRACAT